MNRFPVPFRIIATAILAIVIVAVGVLNLRDRASWQDPSDGVFWVESESGLKAAEVEPRSPGTLAGIVPGDVLLSMDGLAIANLGQYAEVLYNRGPRALIRYGLMSGNEPREAPVELAARRFLRAEDGFRILLAFLYLGIGLYVIIRGGHLSRSYHFFLICLTAFALHLYSYTPRMDRLDWIVLVLSVMALLLLPALFLHFCLRFPVDPKPVRSQAPLLYVPVALLFILQLLWWTGHLAAIGLPTTARSSGVIDRIHLVYFCSGLLIGGAILLQRRMTARDLTARQQMKWVSYGTLAAIVPFSVIYIVPTLLGMRAGLGMVSSQLFLGLIPLSFAYAILHYRLLDVETIVRRSAAYVGASTLLLSLYLILVLGIGRWLQSIAPDADFVVICVGVLAIALLFAPLRNAIQARLDRIFYKEQFAEREGLLDFARTLSSEISLPHLSQRIIERISKTFQIDSVALFLRDPGHAGRYRLADALGMPLPDAGALVLDEAELEGKAETGARDQTRTGESLHRAPARLVAKGIVRLQDLKLHGRRIGLIGLGNLADERHFSSEDLELLEALSRYAGIALENARLYRSVETKALELERLQIYTENILESINIAVLALDLEGAISSCNRAFEELYGVSRSGIAGMPVAQLLAADVIASIQKVTGTAGWRLDAGANIYKLYLENLPGTKMIVNLSIIPLIDPGGLQSGCLLVLDNITEKVRMENQLLQAEKLSSIGLLAAGIAHEVNTPITGISSYAQMLLKETPATDTRKPLLEKIEKQTFRAAEIVNGLLNFARLNGSEFTDLDLNQLIMESLSLLEHQLRRNHVDIRHSLDRSIPPVYGNAGKLQQVFVNLFLNAWDAMPSGGTLVIETSKNDTMVVVDIHDSGTGISSEDIRKIYDPFFTTKSTGKGTGLGLAVTYGIIQEHGGRIFVDSEPSKGTHFRLKLPTRQSLRE